MDRWMTLDTSIRNWLSDRPRMKENNLSGLTVFHLLLGEVNEAIERASQISPEELKTDKELKAELADILWYLLSACILTDTDLYTEAMEKLAFNHIRYESRTYQNGKSFEDAHAWNREFVKKNKLKEEFYEVNLDQTINK